MSGTARRRAIPCSNRCDNGWLWVAGIKQHCPVCKGKGYSVVQLTDKEARLRSPQRPDRKAQLKKGQKK